MKKIISMVALFTFLVVVSGCTGQNESQKETIDQTKTTTLEKKTEVTTDTQKKDTKGQNTSEDTIEKKQSEVTTQKQYKSTKYGFEIGYPNDWHFKSDESNKAEGFFINKNADGKGSYLAILPKGEFDTGLPSSTPTTSIMTIGGKKAQVREWQLSNGKTLRIYHFIDSMEGWTKCGTDLKNCNRIEIHADNSDDLRALESMMTTFSLSK